MVIDTDRDRFYEEPPNNVRFLHTIFGDRRRSDFIDGMLQFATEWFTDNEDEVSLPQEWHHLVSLAEDFAWDVSELQVEGEAWT